MYIIIIEKKNTIIDRVLNISYTTYSARSRSKLMSTYLRDGQERRIQNPVKDLRWSTFEK